MSITIDGSANTIVGSTTYTITSPTLVTPALGTAASGDLRNCSLAVAPAIGGTTPAAGAFTTLSAASGFIARATGNDYATPSIKLREFTGTGTQDFAITNISGSLWIGNGTANNALSIDKTTRNVSVYNGLAVTTTILSSGATSGVGYATGAGGTVTQATNRTTGVTLNKVTGAITLVSAAGTTAWQSFTVTNSAVAATDTIVVNQKSGTDLNMIHVTAVAAGSFVISFATTGGTTTEQPVFNFNVIKGVAA